MWGQPHTPGFNALVLQRSGKKGAAPEDAAPLQNPVQRSGRTPALPYPLNG